MTKYLKDNWVVFEGEKSGLKVQETQFLQLKHKIQEQDESSGQFRWLLKSVFQFSQFQALSGMEVSADHEVCSGYCYQK